MADLTALRARLLNDLGFPSDDAHFTTTILDSLINSALEDIATDYDWPWLQIETTFPTVNAQQAYTPPAGWTRTVWISDDHGRDIQAVQRRDLIQYDGTVGRPHVYAISAEKIRLGPTPNAVITMSHGYIGKETALASPTDVPLCPYPGLIIAYAGARAARKLDDSTLLSMFQIEKKEQIDRIKDNMRRTSSPISIRTRSDFVI